MTEKIPQGTKEFNEIMVALDRNLASQGHKISARPIVALCELSRRYSLSLPITKPFLGVPIELASSWQVSARVYDWYEKRYGERLKVDFSPGRMIILVEDDMWAIRLPKIYGSVRFLVSRTIKSEKKPSSRGPVIYNVVDAIQDMPVTRKEALPDNELEHIYQKFMLGLKAFGLLEGTCQVELIASASADIIAAGEHLLGESSQYGLSKWSSLQAAEKALKAAIQLAGEKFSNTHSLLTLSKQAEAAGLTNFWAELIPYLQCSPGIRYGDEACDRGAALQAHHASLAMMVLLHEGGARFESNLALSH